MILETSSALGALAYSCERGSLDIATVVAQDETAVGEYVHGLITISKDGFPKYKYDGIMGIYSLIDPPEFIRSAYIISFKSGSLIFVYSNSRIPISNAARCIICTDGDEFFETDRILRMAEACNLTDMLPLWLFGEQEAMSELNAWLDSLKIVN